MKTGQKNYRLFFALGFLAHGTMLQGCEGEEKEVSKWVGTYKVEAKYCKRSRGNIVHAADGSREGGGVAPRSALQASVRNSNTLRS